MTITERPSGHRGVARAIGLAAEVLLAMCAALANGLLIMSVIFGLIGRSISQQGDTTGEEIIHFGFLAVNALLLIFGIGAYVDNARNPRGTMLWAIATGVFGWAYWSWVLP